MDEFEGRPYWSADHPRGYLAADLQHLEKEIQIEVMKAWFYQDCWSARGLDADRRANLLFSFDSWGSTSRVCGRPRRRKRFLWSARYIRSGAVVCPASRCGTSHAAGPHGDARTGSKSLKRARKLSAQSWFSRPRLVDRLLLPVLRPARIPDGYPRFATSRSCVPLNDLPRPCPDRTAPRARRSRNRKGRYTGYPQHRESSRASPPLC